jgi:hypothetical protein
MDDPFAVPPIFDLIRQKWIILNRFHTSQGNYVYLMHRWGYSDLPVCDCGFAQQTTTHFFDCLLIILHHDVNENLSQSVILLESYPFIVVQCSTH